MAHPNDFQGHDLSPQQRPEGHDILDQETDSQITPTLVESLQEGLGELDGRRLS